MSKKAKDIKSVIVTVSDDAIDDIDKVAKQLENSGMKVKRVLRSTGVITGSCSIGKIADLEKLTGVMSVEEEIITHLPPPDSTIQ